MGRLIVNDLIEKQGSAKGLAVSVRDPEKAADMAAKGVTVRKADYKDLASLQKAFTGVETLVFISGDSPVVEERIAQHHNVVDAAKAAGVQRVIYTGTLDADPQSPFVYSVIHTDTEATIKASGLGWTLLRPGTYADVGTAQQALATGVLATATQGSVSYISREDIARAASAVALDPSTSGKIYELTGPEAVSYPQFAEILSQVSGKPIQYVAVTYEQLESNLKQAGLPGFVVALVTSIQRAIAEGRQAKVSSDVKLLTGRAAEPFAEVLKRELGRS